VSYRRCQDSFQLWSRLGIWPTSSTHRCPVAIRASSGRIATAVRVQSRTGLRRVRLRDSLCSARSGPSRPPGANGGYHAELTFSRESLEAASRTRSISSSSGAGETCVNGGQFDACSSLRVVYATVLWVLSRIDTSATRWRDARNLTTRLYDGPIDVLGPALYAIVDSRSVHRQRQTRPKPGAQSHRSSPPP
jgi:hypothetical protein